VLTTVDEPGWRERVGEILDEWRDEVVPGAVEPLPHGHYSPVYAWMYAYEKALKRRIERIRGRKMALPTERRLFGPDGAVSEGLSNAFLHGHKRRPDATITVRCCVGRRGLLFSIRDQGRGFDVTSALEGLQKGHGYFHMAGNGLRSFAGDGIEAGYADGGRTLHLLIPEG
jgi:hypothetical protein